MSDLLPPRQHEILRLIAEGRNSHEIARTLYLSRDTVKNYTKIMYRKLGVHDRAHAVTVGFRKGLLS